jgi:predicted PurR-regulated permease PerM
MIGATLGAAICVTVTVFASGIWPEAVIVLAFFIAYQQLENYLIAPRVLRNSVGLSAVAVLLVALVGGTVLGLAGAVMAIPLAAAVKVILTPAVAAMDRASRRPTRHQPTRTVRAAAHPAAPRSTGGGR